MGKIRKSKNNSSPSFVVESIKQVIILRNEIFKFCNECLCIENIFRVAYCCYELPGSYVAESR